MRIFSRWMPPLPPSPPLRIRERLFRVTLLGGILALVVLAAVTRPVPFGIVLLLFLLMGLLGKVVTRSRGRTELRVACERKGEDIGSFARAFDRRQEPFDPWVVRATWDALQVYVRFPLRPTDQLIGDLCIDPDDVYLDLLEDVAERSRHSLADLKANPYLAKVSSLDLTVGDFVRLISWQPKIVADDSSSP